MVKLFYFLSNLAASSLSFLTVLILTNDLHQTPQIVKSDIFLYLIIQVAAGMTNVIIGFSEIRVKFEKHITTNSIAVFAPLTFAASAIDPILGGFFLGVFGALVSYIFIYSGNGRISALLNFTNSLLILIASLITLYVDRKIAPYILLMGSFPVMIFGAIYIIKKNILSNKTSSIQISERDIKNTTLAISFSIIFGLTNIYVPILFHEAKSLATYIIFDKVIGAISIAINSHYMNEKFLAGKKIVFSMADYLKISLLTITVALVALALIESIGGALDYQLKLSNSFADAIILILLGITWSTNLYCGRYLRTIQNGLPIRTKGKKILIFKLLFVLFLMFSCISFIKIFLQDIDDIWFLLGLVYLTYWALILKILRSEIDENSHAD